MHALSRRSLSAALRIATRHHSSATSSPSILTRDDKLFAHRDQIQQFVRSYSPSASFSLHNYQVEADRDTAEAKMDTKSEVMSELDTVGAQISNRASFLPSVLSAGIFSWSGYMERLMNVQTVGDASGQQVKRGGFMFMMSPDNPIITNLNAAVPVDSTSLAAVDLQYDVASLFSGVAFDNLALIGGMVFLLRHTYTGINEIMLDYIHNKNSRTLITILLQAYILISMKDVAMLLVS